MGLDIAFNRAAAVAAGLKLVKERNGTDEDVRRAKEHDSQDTDYIEYLERTDEFVIVPESHLQVHNSGVDDIIVRANRWGSVYYPLTSWLKAHNITWSEF